jgi:hypothetical protein
MSPSNTLAAPHRAVTGRALPRIRDLGAGHLLWAVFLVLNPIYVVDSGLPQPADWLLAVGIGVIALSGGLRVPRAVTFPVVMLWAFVMYGFIVSSAVAVNVGDLEPVTKQVFFIYNAVVFTFVLPLAWREPLQFATATFYGLSVSLAVVMLALLGGYDFERVRQTGLFNNPNQLAYYTVLAFTYLAILSVSLPRMRIVAVVFAIVSLVIGLFGVSFGGVASAVVGVTVYALYLASARRVRSLRTRILLLAIVGLPVVGFAAATLPSDRNLGRIANALSGSWETRLTRVDRKVDELSTQRGYDRIADHPEYWVFGAARGAPQRFGSSLEIHSSLGSVFFSFGLVGTAMFLVFVGWFAASAGGGLFFLTTPIWVYSVGHYGLNQTTFWALFALMVSARRQTGLRRSPAVTAAVAPTAEPQPAELSPAPATA